MLLCYGTEAGALPGKRRETTSVDFLHLLLSLKFPIKHEKLKKKTALYLNEMVNTTLHDTTSLFLFLSHDAYFITILFLYIFIINPCEVALIFSFILGWSVHFRLYFIPM